MKILKFEDEASWLAARRCRITGSRLEDVLEKKRGTGKKVGYYELIAERLAVPPSDENPMDRGHRLEDQALDRFEAMTEKKLSREKVIWTREDNEFVAVSPDAAVEADEPTEAVEVKCLAAPRHIEILLTQEVPSEYLYQVKQYFIVNDKLEKVTLCFYNPDLKVKDFFTFEYKRSDLQADLEALLEHQRMTLAEVDAVVAELTSF